MSTPRVLAPGEEPLPTPVRTPPPTRTPAKPPREELADGSKRVSQDRFRVFNTFVDNTIGSLNRAEVAVWMVLYRDTRDGTARTAQSDIAKRSGCNRRSVCRALKSLEQKGLVEIMYRGGVNRGLSRYRVAPSSRLALPPRRSRSKAHPASRVVGATSGGVCRATYPQTTGGNDGVPPPERAATCEPDHPESDEPASDQAGATDPNVR